MNNVTNTVARKMEKLKSAIESYENGRTLLQALEKEEKSTAGIAERLSAPIIALMNEVAGQKDNGVNQDGEGKASREKEALSVLKEISFTVPRSKLDIGFTKEGLRLQGGKVDTSLPYSAVHRVAILDDLPRDKKKIQILISICKGKEITNGKQKLSALLMQSTKDTEVSMTDPSDPSQTFQGKLPVVLCQALVKMGVPSSSIIPNSSFKSAEGFKAVSAVVRVNQGWLFPLQSAFCFVERPPTVLALDDVEALEPNRTGGVSSTFDLLVHMKDGDVLEFGQIGAGELGKLMQYCEDRNVKVGAPDADEEELAKAKGKEKMQVDDESDDESDEDFDPDAPSDEDVPVVKRKRDEAGPSGYESDSEDEDDSDVGGDSDVELVSEDEYCIPSSFIENLVEEDKSRRKRPRKMGAGSSKGASGSRA